VIRAKHQRYVGQFHGFCKRETFINSLDRREKKRTKRPPAWCSTRSRIDRRSLGGTMKLSLHWKSTAQPVVLCSGLICLRFC
jgi:hypothetical protein